MNNREHITDVLAAVRAQLDTLTDAIDAGDIATLLAALGVAHDWAMKP
jgi:hypothetical protein